MKNVNLTTFLYLLIIVVVGAYMLGVYKHQQKKEYFCEIKGTEKLNSKMEITFDFLGNDSDKLSKKMQIVDEKGNPIEFNSMVAAMNYMSKRDWDFSEAYSTNLEDGTVVEHWILCKLATSQEEARRGILTKEDFEK